MLKKLKQYYKRRWRLSEKLAIRVSMLSSKYNDKMKLSKLGIGCYAGFLTCAGIIAEKWENFYKKKRLRNILKCNQDCLAVDINELLKKKSCIEFFGDDFQYSVATPKEYLHNVKLIFGNADLRALKDMFCLDSLRYVMGDLYISTLKGLEKLEYVGGKIYFQNRKFDSLSEFSAYKENCRI